jgi:hypothetical protein
MATAAGEPAIRFFAVETTHPLNANNPHYAVISVKQPGSRNGCK